MDRQPISSGVKIMASYDLIPIQVEPEFTPETDNTGLVASGYTALEKVRIYNGLPQTINGFVDVSATGATITGVARLFYNQRINDLTKTILGTSSRLYSYFNSELVNITPLVTSTTGLGANPIQTDYTTLGANPFIVINAQNYIYIAHSGHRFVEGDTITISLVAAAVRGIPAAEINGTHKIYTVTTDSYYIYVSTNATSTGSGGGAGVVISSGLITVTDNVHGCSGGERVKLASATATGGITAPQLNTEHIIRSNKITTNTYDIMTAGTSTSSAAGGGAGVTRQGQIAAGTDDASLGVGYGMGLYGAGLYGTSRSGSVVQFPRIWSADAYGNYMIMTAGGQTGVYEWAGDTATAPTLVTNAPTAVNYVFVDREQVITLGAGGTPNRIYTSERGSRTTWTATSQNEVYDATIYGAGKFISHAHVQDINLIFAEDSIYTMQYIGKPLVWKVQQLAGAEGLIAQNARIVINNICYWMSDNDIFMYNGGVVSSITTDSVRRYIFNNLNRSQKSKIHFAYNKQFSEIRIFYPRGGELEPYAWIDFSLKTGKFCGAGTGINITSQEVPFNRGVYPYITRYSAGTTTIQQADNGDPTSIDWSLETSWLFSGKKDLSIKGVIPDSIQSSNINLIAYAKNYPQSSEVRQTTSQVITSTTEEVFFDEGLIRGKCRKYKVNGSSGNFWRAGNWHEMIQPSGDRN